MNYIKTPLDLPYQGDLSIEQLLETGITSGIKTGSLLELSVTSLYLVRLWRIESLERWQFILENPAVIRGRLIDVTEEAVTVPRDSSSDKGLRLVEEGDYMHEPVLTLLDAKQVINEDDEMPFRSVPTTNHDRYTGRVKIPLSAVIRPIYTFAEQEES